MDIDNKKFGIFLLVSTLIVIILIVLIMSNLKPSSTVNTSKEPVIQLKGSSYIEIYKGTNYVEPGYVAIDSIDGDITNKVVVDGNVNTKKVGKYELNYTVTNSKNKSSSVKRDVEVLADEEDSINFYLLGDENKTVLLGDDYVEEGAHAVDSVDGNLSKEIEITGEVDTSKVGKYKVKYKVTNSRGTTKTLTRTVEVIEGEVKFNYDVEYKDRSAIIKVDITGDSYEHMILPNKLMNTRRNIAYEVYEDGTYEFVIVTTGNKIITEKVVVNNHLSGYTYAEKIEFTVGEINLGVGETYRANYVTTPEDTNDIFNWESSNEEVASVSYGEITAKKAGSAIITVRTSNNVNASLIVNVSDSSRVERITLDKHNLSMNVGENYLYIVTIEPSIMDPKIEWSSSDESVAVIDNGILSAVGPGNATIMASVDGVTDYSYVEVNDGGTAPYFPNSITLSPTSLSLKVGEEKTITATLLPSNAVNSSITWNSGNTSIATVKNGKVKGVGVGTTQVTARTVNGRYATATVKVTKSSSSSPSKPPEPVVDNGKLEVHMIFSSNGLTTLIRSKNKVIMVDAGECCENETLIEKIANYVSGLGVTKIDAIYSTHTDTDHNSAMCAINKKAPFKVLYSMTDNWKRRDCVKSKNKKVKLGDVIDYGDFKVEVVGPVSLSSNCTNKGKCSNSDSMNLIITFGKDKFLFTGDYVQSDKLISKWGESKFKNITFVQQPHHGQHDYISGDLIKIMKPTVVFVPAGRNFLSSKMKGYYESVGAKIYNTCNKGNLVAVSDGTGKGLKVYTDVKAKDFKR